MEAASGQAGLNLRIPGIEQINAKGDVLAIIIRASHQEPGIHFITHPDLGQQLAAMSYPSGKTIRAHKHRQFPRHTNRMRETIFVRSGKVRVDLYCREDKLAAQRTISSGDVIMLVDGGHGFEILEPTTMIEVKQGPYLSPEEDKAFITTAIHQA
jgi:hypothetical protein